MKIYIIVIITVLGVMFILALLSYLYFKRWPLEFYLTNTTDQDNIVKLWFNDSYAGEQTIKPKEKKSFGFGSNIQNERANEPFARNQATSIVIYTEQPIKFQSVNIPTKTYILSKDKTGYGQSVLYISEKGKDLFKQEIVDGNFVKIKQPVNWLRSGNWEKPGYYILSFPNGIPIF